METLDEACKLAIKVGKRTLKKMSDYKPEPQFNWWGSGKLLNGHMIQLWESKLTELEDSLEKVKEKPSYSEASNLIYISCDINDFYKSKR